MNLNELTIKQASEGLAKKEFSAAEITQACLDKIEKTEEKLKTFVTVAKEQAQKQAIFVDELNNFTSPLDGIPVAIKDLFCTKGIKTTASSKILENYIPPYSATSVERLGKKTIIIGKNNLDEFACGSSTETSYFGASRNPWDIERVPGGSSGGSAASIAAHQAIYSLGTDTGGSIRQPASLCGVVGLKPTYGRVSRFGVIAMASSLDQVGPITKTVEDAAIIMEHIAGKDKYDSTTSPKPTEKYSEEIKKDIKGLRVGIPAEYFGKGLDPDVKVCVEDAIKKLETLGATTVEINLPYSEYGLAVYYILMPSELSSNLARFDGVRYGFSAKAENLLENYLESRGQGFGSEIRRRIMLGTYALSSGYYDAYYKKALQVRTLVKQDFQKAFEKVDVIATPTTPTVAFKIGEKTTDPLTMYLSDIFTVSTNIAGIPAISVPCGFAKPSGGGPELPVGLQLIGNDFAESTILRAAHHYEQSTDWYTKKPVL